MKQKINIKKFTKNKKEKNFKKGFQVDDDEEINEELLNDNICDDIDLEMNNDNIDLNEQMNLDKILQ